MLVRRTLAIPVWRSTHFYFCHRFIHTRFMYKQVLPRPSPLPLRGLAEVTVTSSWFHGTRHTGAELPQHTAHGPFVEQFSPFPPHAMQPVCRTVRLSQFDS